MACADYTPLDDDILHARGEIVLPRYKEKRMIEPLITLSVRTMGATEERFYVDKSLSYRIIDVGGSRTQRNVWAQFFEEATAIIFLAPISAFDEVNSK